MTTNPYLPFHVSWSSTQLPVTIPLEVLGEATAPNISKPVEAERLVVLFDDEALLGSGVLVCLDDGSPAILTARHVVMDLVVAGAVHCVVPEWGWTSVEPTSLRVHPRSDIALVRLPNRPTTGIAWERWNPMTVPTNSFTGSVLPMGTPGEWKGPVDLSARTIAGLRALGAWCDVDPQGPVARRLALRVNATSGLPQSFGGMSGGPVFASEGRIVGVITHESLSGPRHLYAAPLDTAASLLVPYQVGSDFAQDLQRQVGGMIVPVRYKDTRRFPHSTFHIVAVFEHFWSNSDPEQRISRLVALGCATAPTSRRFVMNTESIFYPSETTLEEHMRQCGLELNIMLNTPGVEVLESGPRPPVEAERLLITLIRQLAPSSPLTMVRPADED